MWRRKLTWDELLPPDLAKEFLKWYDNIEYLKDCKVPRRLTTNKLTDCRLSLHMFCDASKNAMAACIFLRAEKDNKATVQLVAAKSRVAPPKNICIPRLELMAAVIGVRLLVETRNSLALDNCSEYYWTDSSVALYWICNNLSWNIFVGNRVKEIREGTKTGNWLHISGSSNWADLASRGCDAKQLLDCRWIDGPEFLLRNSEDWPKSSVKVDDAEAKKELKVAAKSTCNVNVSLNETFSDRFLYFSKYDKIVRVVAWLLRFTDNCLKKKTNILKEDITVDEYERAERKIFLLLQEENKNSLELKCKNIHTLQDVDQLRRIKTRLLLSSMSENTKCPILLPAKSEIVRRLVEQRHVRLQHAGMNNLIADIRKSYWIFGIRRLARSVIMNCMICKRYRVKQMQAPVAPLPVDRMESSLPFEVTGVDLAGHLYLKNGEKCWIVIFTCAVYRAVHLELTQSLSTEAFLRTLRRFIARRGRVRVIYSDNGSNLVGSRNMLDSLDWNKIQHETCTTKIKWKLNAPTGAWWGGFFERLIRTMKDLLRKVLGKARVTYDELHTLLCECESVMNNRPLTYIQDDNADSLEPLTPACFLQPLPNSDTTDLDLLDSNSLNVRLKYLQKLRDDFRHRFKTEYLTELIQRGKEKPKYEEVKEGQVVLVETEEKRFKWPLGIITKVYTGKDGVNRTALIRTATGLKVRPIQRLYSLEVVTDDLEALGISKLGHSAEEGKESENVPSPENPDQVKDDENNTISSPREPVKVSRYGRRILIPTSKACTTRDGRAGECVVYYNCDALNNTVITDGSSAINSRHGYLPVREVRFKRDAPSEECESIMDVCCIVTDITTTPKPPIVTANRSCGYRNPEGVGFKTTGVVNGETKFAEFPWVCGILRVYSNSEVKMYLGGGSLIHPSVVLTAVHSAAQFPGLMVRAGEWNLRTTQELYPYQDREVGSTEIHQDFKKDNLFYDISLLFLTQPMDLAPNVALACLPPPPMPPLNSIQRVAGGTRCFATGWGKDKFYEESRYQAVLKKIEMPVKNRDTCEAQLRSTRLGRYFQLHKSFMCAGGEPGKDACMGDGGSPLSCPIESEENRYMQSGIVAWGIGCGTAGVPGVYVDVAYFRKWVDDKVSARGYDPKVYTF